MKGASGAGAGMCGSKSCVKSGVGMGPDINNRVPILYQNPEKARKKGGCRVTDRLSSRHVL